MKHKLAAGATPPGKSDLEFRRRASMLRGCRVSTLGPVLSAGIVGISFTCTIASGMAASGNQPWLSLEQISACPEDSRKAYHGLDSIITWPPSRSGDLGF